MAGRSTGKGRAVLRGLRGRRRSWRRAQAGAATRGRLRRDEPQGRGWGRVTSLVAIPAQTYIANGISVIQALIWVILVGTASPNWIVYRGVGVYSGVAGLRTSSVKEVRCDESSMDTGRNCPRRAVSLRARVLSARDHHGAIGTGAQFATGLGMCGRGDRIPGGDFQRLDRIGDSGYSLSDAERAGQSAVAGVPGVLPVD